MCTWKKGSSIVACTYTVAAHKLAGWLAFFLPVHINCEWSHQNCKEDGWNYGSCSVWIAALLSDWSPFPYNLISSNIQLSSRKLFNRTYEQQMAQSERHRIHSSTAGQCKLVEIDPILRKIINQNLCPETVWRKKIGNYTKIISECRFDRSISHPLARSHDKIPLLLGYE